MTTVSPKGYLLYLFFKDLESGDFPLRVSAETTNHCNLRCHYCPRTDSNRGYGYMSDALFDSLASQCADKQMVFAPQGLGEPFLDPRFLRHLHRARELDVRYVDITTNATLMDEAACRALIDTQAFLVSIEIDGADKAVYERNRPNADYDVTVANVQRLFRMRQEAGSELPYVSLSAIQLPEVVPSMAAFEALWRPLLGSMDEIFIAQPVTWAGDRPLPGRRGATAEELRTRPTCRHLYKTLQVYFDGRATPCTYDHACKLQVGDASRQSIHDIWHGEPLRKLRALHEQGRSGEIDLCRNCPDHLA